MLTRISKGPATPTTGLVDLLMECHTRIRYFVALAHRIGSDDAAPPQERVEACLRVERYFTEALPLHVADEEHSILPRLSDASPDVQRALSAMHEQHASHGEPVAALLTACRLVREAPSDPHLLASLSQAATTLSREFDAHLTLEETTIFPAIRACLDAQTQAQIVDELRARRLGPFT